jgi:solute carrier family 25 S-adenosylmethionine transporter 26
LDTVKTRLQAQGGFVQAGGFRGLWQGLTPVLLRSVPCSTIFFVTYEQMRSSLEHKYLGSTWPSAWREAVAGGVANVAQCSVRVPCEVLKQQMQARGSSSACLADSVRQVGANGLRGFYRGSGATVARELAFALVQMPCFEELKRLHPWSADDSVGRQGLVGAICGGLAGALAGAATTPLDVAKTQIMLSQKGSDHRGVFRTMVALYEKGGTEVLFRGAGPRTAYVCASCALSFGAFQWARALLGGTPGQTA